jgi:molybdopterin-guanine dinucleotide biosynthesis protein A
MFPKRASGYVLAGGRSSRMGREKATLPWQGTTLIRHIAAIVESAAGSVATVGGSPVPGIRHLPDQYPGFGPVGGIATALCDSRTDWNLVIACDMPCVTGEFLASLLQRAFLVEPGPGFAPILIPVTGDGRTHPLCAAYHCSVKPTVLEAVDGGIHKLLDVVARAGSIPFPVDDNALVRNVNTPGEWTSISAGAQG